MSSLSIGRLRVGSTVQRYSPLLRFDVSLCELFKLSTTLSMSFALLLLRRTPVATRYPRSLTRCWSRAKSNASLAGSISTQELATWEPSHPALTRQKQQRSHSPETAKHRSRPSSAMQVDQSLFEKPATSAAQIIDGNGIAKSVELMNWMDSNLL